MDTINNMSTAASQAIWGDQTQDPNIPKTTPRATETGASTLPSSTNTTPISGQVGDVRGGEPYDKGNIGKTIVGFYTAGTH
ncbi:hypothetical protein BJ875DRAFT_383437 [Amylocarpus encephaloides]|uniref:Uncharacterized protein n=1 Tax=Amylocarpus encephaloides TaxID=45428 RepID=A0A9P7YDJ0_9HELO|nr:hypothetical protein BJ875DRAFT_383437 [Amylocarpus encephaloides]